jgi:transcription initiation factor TFIIB
VKVYSSTTIKIIEKQKENKKITDPTTCSVYHKDYTDIITDSESGEVVCGNCGMVISEKAQDMSTPEWRAFTAEERNEKARTGAPTSLAIHDRGLATIISSTDRDASGQKLDISTHTTFKRLRTWDFRTQRHSSSDRSLWTAFSQLDTLKDKLGLSDAIIEKTAYIYRKAQERSMVRGRTLSSILAAAVYIACREMGVPKTLKDISTISNIKRKDIARNYRQLVNELGIKIPVADHMKCIARIANNANLTEKTKRHAMNMMKEVIKREIPAGKHPMSLAATVLYLSSIKTGESVSQIDIAEAAGITEVTLRNRIKELNIKLRH